MICYQQIVEISNRSTNPWSYHNRAERARQPFERLRTSRLHAEQERFAPSVAYLRQQKPLLCCDSPASRDGCARNRTSRTAEPVRTYAPFGPSLPAVRRVDELTSSRSRPNCSRPRAATSDPFWRVFPRRWHARSGLEQGKLSFLRRSFLLYGGQRNLFQAVYRNFFDKL